GSRDAEELEKAILQTTKSWAVGHGKWLLPGRTPEHGAASEFDPGPKGEKRDEWRTRFEFAEAPKRLGVPHVQLRATVTVQARFAPSAADKSPGSTAATPAWPTKDERIVSAMRELTSGRATPREKVLSILRFTSGSVKTGGPMGSRHGARKVLKQRFGHCWDKSDLLITLCRAAGIPARQVAGWVPPLNAGHVWAEVRLGEAGWIPVDATAPWLGISEDYIPLYGTSDGDMPIVYLGWPQVKRVK
ncbi:MAG: transglutaminase domain-containing protein, partial [bacterium]|nr:transglutaminase domain-containing protein [bacterium]